MKIWQVKIYNKPNYQATIYHFQNKSDIEKSIELTWGKTPSAFHRENMSDESIVLTNNSTKDLLLEAIELEFNLRTTPTHF
jgi:hypothetical protein